MMIIDVGGYILTICVSVSKVKAQDANLGGSSTVQESKLRTTYILLSD